MLIFQLEVRLLHAHVNTTIIYQKLITSPDNPITKTFYSVTESSVWLVLILERRWTRTVWPSMWTKMCHDGLLHWVELFWTYWDISELTGLWLWIHSSETLLLTWGGWVLLWSQLCPKSLHHSLSLSPCVTDAQQWAVNSTFRPTSSSVCTAVIFAF